jgi:NADPH:quinone reductase-like Zn-dependent oxidoreductase
MQAIAHTRYGPADVLKLVEVEKPSPRDDEVLIKVYAASVHPDVWHVVTGWPFALRLMGSGLARPKNPIPGTDVAGRIEAVGQKVTRFKVGDAVFGESVHGHQWANGGAYAEYVAVSQDHLALKPADITFEQAAAVPTSGMIALWNLGHGEMIKPGHKVLVNGAAGGVGAFAVQLAKAFGAQVTGVDSTNKLNLMRSIGADHVIDFTRDDFTRRDEHYDLIFDIPGNHRFAKCRRVLTERGKYILIGHDHFGGFGRRWLGSLPRFFGLTVMSLFINQLPRTHFEMPNKKDLMVILSELLDAGKITPVIDKTFPLRQASEALRYLQAGKAKGKIVITIRHDR